MKALSDDQFAYLLILPLIIISLAMIVYPLAFSFWLTLNDVNFGRPSNVYIFTGFEQWVKVLYDPQFLSSFLITIRFAFIAVVVSLLLSLGIALLLNEPLKGRGLLRALVIVPWAIPEYAVGVLWKYLYDADIGLFNGILYVFHIIPGYTTLMLESNAVELVAIAYSWHMASLGVFFFLPGLSFISQEEYRAARIDGAGSFRRFWHITLPHLRYPLLVWLVFLTMESVRALDIILTMTGGGPNLATNTLSFIGYKQTFQLLNLSPGATLSYYLMFLTIALAMVYFYVLYRPKKKAD
jgi:ABC-type sugar transport system permease subunit